MAHVVTVDLKQDKDFRFAIHFAEAIAVLYGDETPPLGDATGPTRAQLLAAAMGNCLSDSLLFAIRKFKQRPGPTRYLAGSRPGRRMKPPRSPSGIPISTKHRQAACDTH
jgi:hypothetical protein